MKAVLPALAVLAGCAASAFAQTPTYTFEMRLIADGDAGAPTGTWAQLPNDPNAPRIGFWLQCRVSQTSGQNYGMARVSSPPLPGSSSISLSGAAGALLERGTVNAAGTQFGRGSGFRVSNGTRAAWDTAAQSAPDAGAYPSALHNDNGAFDTGQTRIYGFDAWIGAQRNTANAADPNPWGDPLVGSNTFSPWANIYRFVVVNSVTANTTVTINAAAQLNGTLGVVQVGETDWIMRMSAPQNGSASYQLPLNAIPTPGAAVMFGVGGVLVIRRRG
jgi:hypothetical protein